METPTAERLDSESFYTNYFGHPINQLENLVANKPDSIPSIYFVGDSTLDNKFWVPNHQEHHPNSYIRSRLDSNPILCRDVAYWLSKLYGDTYTVLNCAVEQTLLRSRASKLFPQDELVKSNICEDDILVVSVGGNDIALSPTFCTAMAVIGQVLVSSHLGLSTLSAIFKTMLHDYICDLLDRRKPKLVVICMVYYPDENAAAESWAGLVLKLLRYNSQPQRLQQAIHTVFEKAVKQIHIPDTTVVFAPLFEVLDGKDTSDYVARVEPSEQGGGKIAELLRKIIDENL